jgi:hypothetical protein
VNAASPFMLHAVVPLVPLVPLVPAFSALYPKVSL